jgi:hypothetical protein
MARQLDIPAAPFANYARRPQTMTDHARLLSTALGLRPSANSDLPMMIEAAAKAAWGTDHGQPIAAAAIAALRAAKMILPPSGVIERAAIAGRACARRRATDALLMEVSAQQVVKLEQLLVFDTSLNMTPLPGSRRCRSPQRQITYASCWTACAGYAMSAYPPESQSQSTRNGDGREGHVSDAHQLSRYDLRILCCVPRSGRRECIEQPLRQRFSLLKADATASEVLRRQDRVDLLRVQILRSLVNSP